MVKDIWHLDFFLLNVKEKFYSVLNIVITINISQISK